MNLERQIAAVNEYVDAKRANCAQQADNCCDPALRVTPLDEVLARVHYATEILVHAVGNLEERLSKILHEPEDTKESGVDHDKPKSRSELVDSLYLHADNLYRIRDHISGLIDRLDT